MARPHRRGSWRGIALLALALGSLLAPCGRRSPPGPGERGSWDGRGLQARVVEVTDGDTIRVEPASGEEERVRYIGIDTPESTPDQPLECFGREAAEANAGLVAGSRVELRFGPERRDDYGRLLAYVRAPGPGGAGTVFVNAALVEGGYARTLTIAPNDARAPLFAHLEAAAARRGRGLWGACDK